MDKRTVFGTTGTICAGKGIVAGILKSSGCDVVTLGEIVRDSLNSRGLATTRENQQDEGNRLREEYGGQILAERALEKYSGMNPLVIDGIRNIAEIDYLQKQSRFILIGVDAPFELRWERQYARKRDPDLTYNKFIADDARDQGHNEPINGQQVGMCLAQADYLIYNDENFDRLEDSKIYREVMEIYKKMF